MFFPLYTKQKNKKTRKQNKKQNVELVFLSLACILFCKLLISITRVPKKKKKKGEGEKRKEWGMGRREVKIF